jgi:hypothetical protein
MSAKRFVVEQQYGTAVEMLLQAGDLEIGIYLDVRLQDVALGIQPLESRPQR